MSRLFAIGDIHGCAAAFDALLAAIDLQPNDWVVTLGDYLNKGPDTRAVFDRLIALHRSHRAVSLRGNHELKLLRAARDDEIGPDGYPLVDRATLASYGSGDRPGTLADIPDAHWEFVARHCQDWWETDRHLFAHAGAAPDRPMTQQSERALFWDKFVDPQPHQSGKTLICGHTCQKSGNPVNRGHAICIDTWACGSGWLSALEVNSGRLWQAKQDGRQRVGHIDAYLPPQSRGVSAEHRLRPAARAGALQFVP